MRLTCLLILGLAGCQNCWQHGPGEASACAPGYNEGIVVQAPRPKVIIETPAQAPAPAPEGAASAQAAPAPAPAPAVPGAAMAAPMMGYPMIGGQAFGQGLGATGPITTQIRERTGFGFVFDTVKIPIPILRPIAVPRPAEVTMQFPTAPQGSGAGGLGFAAGLPVGGVPMGLPLAASMGMAGGMGFAAPMGMAGGMGFAAPAPTFALGQVPAQGQLTPAQAALVQALAAQMASGAGANASSAASAQSAGTSPTDQQLEQLLQKCEELKRLKELKQQMEKAGDK
jgi:hypothetical protein